MEHLRPSDLFAHYYKPTVGSMQYSLGQIALLLKPPPPDDPDRFWVDDPELAALVAEAVGLTKVAAERRYMWRNRQRVQPLRRQGAVQADNNLDRSISGFHDHTSSYDKLPVGHSLRVKAEGLRAAVLPMGAFPITSLPFEEQHAAVKVLLAALDGEHREVVCELGLEPFVDAIRECNEIYGASLSSLNQSGVTSDQVQSAHRAALDGFFSVVLAIWHTYREDATARNALLATVHEQNARIRRHYRRRNTAPQIDPTTGEVIEDEVDLGFEVDVLAEPGALEDPVLDEV